MKQSMAKDVQADVVKPLVTEVFGSANCRDWTDGWGGKEVVVCCDEDNSDEDN